MSNRTISIGEINNIAKTMREKCGGGKSLGHFVSVLTDVLFDDGWSISWNVMEDAPPRRMRADEYVVPWDAENTPDGAVAHAVDLNGWGWFYWFEPRKGAGVWGEDVDGRYRGRVERNWAYEGTGEGWENSLVLRPRNHCLKCGNINKNAICSLAGCPGTHATRGNSWGRFAVEPEEPEPEPTDLSRGVQQFWSADGAPSGYTVDKGDVVVWHTSVETAVIRNLYSEAKVLVDRNDGVMHVTVSPKQRKQPRQVGDLESLLADLADLADLAQRFGLTEEDLEESISDFNPDRSWDDAPHRGMRYYTIDKNGSEWFSHIEPVACEPDGAWQADGCAWEEAGIIEDMTGIDWTKTLRVRPEVE